ncbi:MAG: Gfo/Idh/MocA family protein [Geminicoccaceae bacterium]
MPSVRDEPLELAVVGAGLIGRRHIDHVRAEPDARLSAIVDPTPSSRELAEALGVRWFASLPELLGQGRPDGVIVATPNQLHVQQGLLCVEAGVPALIEKPLADELDTARTLVEAAEAAQVPLLTGHHRRHNPIMREAKAVVGSGRLGPVVAVHAQCWLKKPAEYFDAAWRRNKGAGPVFINLIHDLDNLRYLCGEVAAVQAQESNARRGHEVEDTAAILLRFASGALGTLTVSDTIAAPWSWELTSGENPAYFHTVESCYLIGGVDASLSVPRLEIWRHAGRSSWWEPIACERLPVTDDDPLRLQLGQFCRVIRGIEPPLVSGREGLATLRVVAAIKEAAASGRTVEIAS